MSHLEGGLEQGQVGAPRLQLLAPHRSGAQPEKGSVYDISAGGVIPRVQEGPAGSHQVRPHPGIIRRRVRPWTRDAEEDGLQSLFPSRSSLRIRGASDPVGGLLGKEGPVVIPCRLYGHSKVVTHCRGDWLGDPPKGFGIRLEPVVGKCQCLGHR